MIRSTLIKAIHDVLKSHSYLSLEDFTIQEYANKKAQPCLMITYRYDTHPFFKFHIPTMKTKLKDSSFEHYYFNCTMNPGQESAEETIDAEERQGLLEAVSSWRNRIYEDLLSAPILRQLEAQASALSDLQERLKNVPDEPLSESDIIAFQENLNTIKEEFTQQLKQINADKDDLKMRIDELSKDIELLKNTLPSMTKRQWGELLIVRMKKWKERFSLRQIAAGTRVIKQLLPPDVSDGLDGIADFVDNIAEVVDKKSK